MTIDFDLIVDRTGSSSVKYDVCKAYFGTDDVTPLWIADMDFSAPEAVTQALIERAQHPIYGYTAYPNSLFNAMQDWFKHRHNWSIDRQSILMCPGVVPSMHAAIEALSQPGDGVIIQPPIYPPFVTAVTETGRKLVENPLKLEQGVYTIDFDHLEQSAASGTKLLILCSPHNPVGRVWQQQELECILDIARRYQLTIISDEIHADLIYPDQRHIPLATLADDVAIVTAVSPSKTFNIAGLGLSCLVSNDRQQLRAISKVFDSWHISASNPFSIAAFEAAYRDGAAWLDELMGYVDETRRQVSEFVENNLKPIKLIASQGTYLLWLDCREMAMSDDELNSFFIAQAKVGMNPGISFGQVGSGFMRMNIAAPRKTILDACQQIAQALMK
ncbi:MAG: aminotransferase [Methylophaga sp.]|nr:MAG: aminotransferase [Methylophaga sp.]